jgi:flagellar protein FlaI
MQQLGYKVQSMMVQSSLGGRGEKTAEDALKVTLRLGESAIVMGEVRGQEARILYEAMRTGTAGSSVLGTFHADTPKAVFDRVTSDMGIPQTSFQATDIVIIAGLKQPGGTARQVRRVTQISELLKNEGTNGTFRDLFVYDDKTGIITETDVLKYKSEKIGAIAKSWGLTMEDAMEGILARAAYREHLVNYAVEHNKLKLLSAEWVYKTNSLFRELCNKHQNADGKVNYNAALTEWNYKFDRSAAYA